MPQCLADLRMLFHSHCHGRFIDRIRKWKGARRCGAIVPATLMKHAGLGTSQVRQYPVLKAGITAIFSEQASFVAQFFQHASTNQWSRNEGGGCVSIPSQRPMRQPRKPGAGPYYHATPIGLVLETTMWLEGWDRSACVLYYACLCT